MAGCHRCLLLLLRCGAAAAAAALTALAAALLLLLVLELLHAALGCFLLFALKDDLLRAGRDRGRMPFQLH